MSAASPYANDHVRHAIHDVFAERITANKAPGSCYAVFDASDMLFSGGLGCANDANEPPTATTCFRIASCTKSFTAAAVLLLRDQQRLNLDAAITDFVPELAQGQASATFVAPTLRMLLMMKGGLFKDDPWADRMESCTREALRAVLSQGVRFTALPGERYEYSNLGYALLGQVIEQVSGNSYARFVEENLLAPLELTASGFDYRAFAPASLATGYRFDGTQWRALPMSAPGGFSSIGGLLTNVIDLSAWNRWLMQAFITTAPDTGPLSKASRREMQQLQAVIPWGDDTSGAGAMAGYTGYGYGLMREERLGQPTLIGHSGGYPGFSAYMCWCPEAQLGVLGFENATYAGVSAAVRAAMALLLQQWRQSTPVKAPVAAQDIQHLADELLRLLQHWDDDRANRLCLPNVGQDIPYAERRQQLAVLMAKAGALEWQQARLVPAAQEGGFERFCWQVPGANGMLVCRAQVGPPEPLRLQAFELSLATHQARAHD